MSASSMNAPTSAPPLLAAFVGTPAVNRIYNVTAEVMLAALPDASIDLVVTSPPYGSLRKYSGNWSFDFEYIAQQTYRVLKPGAVLVWIVADISVNGSEQLVPFEQAQYFKNACGFCLNDTMIYLKKGVVNPQPRKYRQEFEYMFILSKGQVATFNPIMKANRWAGDSRNRGSKRNADGTMQPKKRVPTAEESMLGNVWEIDVGYMKTTKDIEAYDHPAMFPEDLAEKHILTWSNAGDVVLDFFGGSGTTAKMARKNGRQYITCDISLEYCQLMQKRLDMPYTPSFMPALEAAAAS